MTKKELARATYVNESKKKRKEKTSAHRKNWTGIRPVIHKDKTKYNRQKNKQIREEE